MIVKRKPTVMQSLKVGQYLFGQVEDFKYTGININQRNDMHNEIKLRLVTANRGYHTMRSMLSSRLLSIETKTKLYIAYLRPIAIYACETWSTIRGNELKLLIFERKILRKIYGPIINPETGSYERRKNEDIESILNKPYIQACLKAKRLEWAGHVCRAKDKLIHNVLINKPNGKRKGIASDGLIK
jgi:hypothetical protein